MFCKGTDIIQEVTPSVLTQRSCLSRNKESLGIGARHESTSTPSLSPVIYRNSLMNLWYGLCIVAETIVYLECDENKVPLCKETL